MVQWLSDLRAALNAVQPGLFNAILAVLLFGLMYGWKKLSPATFDRLPASLQAWPALFLGVVASALAQPIGQDFGAELVQLVAGTLSGLFTGAMAVGTHHVLKESPLPYGNVADEARKTVPPKPA